MKAKGENWGVWRAFRRCDGSGGDGEQRDPEKWIGEDFDWQTRGRIACRYRLVKE